MFWNDKKQERNKVEIIQKQLQDENEQFDVTIMALEKLESLLVKEKKYEKELTLTAMGTERDKHPELRSVNGAFKELKLQCTSLNICAEYEENEVFELAVQHFMKNLYEWYAGREVLEFYDEVDSAIIPIMYALLNKDLKDLDSEFEKYVYKASKNENESINDKYETTRTGLEAWILAQHYFSISQKEKKENDLNEGELIISHKRGETVDGYIRIIKALTTMFYNSAPAKFVYQMTAKFLPEIVESVPHINEEYIESFYDKKQEEINNEILDASLASEIEMDVDKTNKDVKAYLNKYNKETILPILQEIVKQKLEENKVEYNEIIIEIR